MNTVILLVDDYDDALVIYSTYLQHRGMTVICAENGARAIELARERRPNLILMDLRMPEMSGTAAMQTLREDPSFATVPIVALTAHAMAEERSLAFAAGFDAVISKPCLPDDLFVLVQDLLQHGRSERP